MSALELVLYIIVGVFGFCTLVVVALMYCSEDEPDYIAEWNRRQTGRHWE